VLEQNETKSAEEASQEKGQTGQPSQMLIFERLLLNSAQEQL